MDAIKKARPDWSDDDADMYLGVMELSKEHFIKYAKKIGIDTSLADDFFKQQKEESRTQAKARWDEMSDRTLKTKDGIMYKADVGPEMQAIADKGLRADAKGTLENTYGMTLINSNNTDPALVHKQTSQLLNMAEANPVLAQTMREKVRGIEYRDNPSGSTAIAEFRPTTGLIHVYPTTFDLPAGTWVHEIGHAAEGYTNGGFWKFFGQGKIASSYGDIKPSEDFAEMFELMVGGSHVAEMKAWVPKKYNYMLDNVPGLREMIE